MVAITTPTPFAFAVFSDARTGRTIRYGPVRLIAYPEFAVTPDR